MKEARESNDMPSFSSKQQHQPIYDIGTLVWEDIRTPEGRQERKKIKRVRGAWIRLWNNHPKLTDGEIWDVIKHVTKGMRWRYYSGIEVVIKTHPSGNFHASFHCSPEEDPIITAYITNRDDVLPDFCRYKKGGGYIDKLLLSKTEALIAILAHEFRHLWQYDIEEFDIKHRRRGYVWGARGVMSDRDADAYAIRKVREYRRQIQQQESLNGAIAVHTII